MQPDNPARFDFLVCGHLSRDILYASGREVCRLGGVAYAASVLARFGVRVGMLAPLTDPDGAAILAELRQRGIDCEGIQYCPGEPVIYEIQDADEVVDQRTVRMGPPPHTLPFPTSLPAGYRGVQCALIYPVNAAFALARASELKSEGTKIAIDLQHDVQSLGEARELLNLSDYVFVNVSSVRRMARDGSLDTGIAALRGETDAPIILKMGLAGSLIYADQPDAIEIPSYLSNYRFTVGAGDAYDAAFLLASIRGKSLADAGNAAALAAADVIESSERDPSQSLAGVDGSVLRQPVFLHPRVVPTLQIYVTGHAHSTPLRHWIELAVAAVEKLGLRTFAPHRDAEGTDDYDVARPLSYAKRLEGVRTSHAVLVLLDGAERGEAYVEIGVAIERGVPVLALSTDRVMNIPDMVVEASDAIVGDLASMANALMQCLAEYPKLS